MYQSLVQYENTKSSNLQFMKYLAACLVIISHAYPLCGGSQVKDPLYQMTTGQLSFGGLAVAMFFLCGGYFIAKSMEYKKTANLFFSARCKKIFPLLWCTILGCIMMGAIITSYPLKEYIVAKGTWMFLANGILIPVHNLPGVFQNAPYNATVNGALWTLSVEFICYIGCYICYKIKCFFPKKFLLILVPTIVGTILLLLLEKNMPSIMQIIRPIILFIIGMAFWIFREHIKVSKQLGIITSILFGMCLFMKIANIGLFLFFPFVCFSIWFSFRQVSNAISRLGDISYGLYLCGFPIQQLLVYLFDNNMNIYVNMLIAIPIASMIGFLMYLFVDKKIQQNTRKAR